MRSPHRTVRPVLLALPLALLLAACGGSSAEEDLASAGGPRSATVSADPAPSDHGEDHGEDHGKDGGHDHAGHAHLDIAESGVGELLGTGDGHGHRLRQVPADGAPTVALEATADPAGGWTVRTATQRWTWTADQVNTPADAGAGHAHLYVGDAKVARTYGEWHFLPGSAAEAGDVLEVVLYADDHTAWAVDGRAVAAQVELPAVG